MLNRLILNTVRQITSAKLSKSSSKVMDKCYFRYVEKEDNVNITFLYKINENSTRQFNLKRKASETVEDLLYRISTNVVKVAKRKNKIKTQDSDDTSSIEVNIFKNGNLVPKSVKCSELINDPDNLKLSITNQTFDVIVNAPWVLNIGLPQSILSGFPVYPVHFETMFSHIENSTFNWFTGKGINDKGNNIMDNDIQWQLVSKGFTYVPLPRDIGLKLKLECIPGNTRMLGPAVEAISQGFVEAGPGKCPFENRHAFTQNKLNGKSFRIVSYNILADLYCNSDYTRTVLHPYCPPYALQIDYRKQLILKELLGYNADIACLQEVDMKIFKHVLEPILSESSIKGVFTKKAKEVAEGLACFYRSDRFRLVSKKEMLLSESLESMECFKDIWDKVKNNEALKERILNRSTACQATILQSIDNPSEVLVVGNTHLYFHPDADHIRLLQGGMVIYWLNEIMNETSKENPNSRVSLVICGDFNSVPSCGIYKLYTAGVASSDLEDWKSNKTEEVIGLTLKQDIPLGSACGTPEYTNFTAEFADCLDYIYYDTRHISVEQVVPFPSTEELKEHTALPSVVFPSDHIALVADLNFK